MDIRYLFSLSDGRRHAFDIHLDPETMRLSRPTAGPLPSWTHLQRHQCPHCPLTVATHPHCPVAANLVAVILRFSDLFSYDPVEVRVTTPERQVLKRTTCQVAISSLMGLMIAVSDCPHTDFFKPMARFHLPFASPAETIWRAASTYLLATYFDAPPDRSLRSGMSGLAHIYENIEVLNRAVIERLREAGTQDSSINALIRLDVLAKHLVPCMESALEQIRDILAPFRESRGERG